MKPHIRITAYKLWRCLGGIVAGYGSTPQHAYLNWDRNRKIMESEITIERP